jgi:hypothetical protein
MRVAYLTHQYFPRHVGGTEVYTRGLALRAAVAGAALEVLTYHESPSGDRRDYGVVALEHDGIPVREIHYNLSRPAIGLVAPDRADRADALPVQAAPSGQPGGIAAFFFSMMSLA